MSPMRRGEPATTELAPEKISHHLGTERDHRNAPRTAVAAVPGPCEPQSQVTGVLEIDLGTLPDWPRIPRGVSLLRVTVGRTWADLDALIRVANASWVARVPVEVVGSYGPTLVDAAQCIERRIAECRQADAEFEQRAR